jgi:hypothetical protein
MHWLHVGSFTSGVQFLFRSPIVLSDSRAVQVCFLRGLFLANVKIRKLARHSSWNSLELALQQCGAGQGCYSRELRKDSSWWRKRRDDRVRMEFSGKRRDGATSVAAWM